MFLARKIAIAKWDNLQGARLSDIWADAITTDLRTINNKLSLWQCSDADEASLRDVALALASNRTDLNKIDIVWVSQIDLERGGHILQPTRSGIPVDSLAHNHIELCEMNYGRIGHIAELIRLAIEGDNCHRFKTDEVTRILLSAIEDGRLDYARLKTQLKNKLPPSP